MNKVAIALVLSLTSLVVNAKPFHYLEEKTAYCYSAASLAKYLKLARIQNMDGLNQLVLKGKCDFVPDGQVYSLTDYRKTSIGSMPVISFEKDQKTLWTFKALVSTSQISDL